LAAHGEEALDVAALNSPQLVILDLVMPGLDGFEVCRQLREWSKVPIIAISSSDSEADKITALDLGADDYVVKPFGIGEMQARVRAILRRANFEPGLEPPVFACDGLQIDFSRRLVTVDNNEVHLTPKEYDLLRYMATNADRVLTSRHLLSKFWGNELADDNHTLRVHVANLRRKVEKDPENPRYILTEVRVGYRLKTGVVTDLVKLEAKMKSKVRAGQLV
jgi:two-component system KDP operon response regulator KdpE